MAISNQERVGKAMDLLRVGLAPFVEREFNNLHQAQAADAARRYLGDDRTVSILRLDDDAVYPCLESGATGRSEPVRPGGVGWPGEGLAI
jgi:hypothetical protein